MKVLQFLMLGNRKYINGCMRDESITENLVRNIKGAARIGGKIRITVSDELSQKTLFENFSKLGITKREAESVQFVTESDVLESYKQAILSKSEKSSGTEAQRLGSEYYKLLKAKGNPSYIDVLKVLSIYDAPKGQIVEFADLDQQVDITQNLDFKIGRKYGLYTSMHLGRDSTDPLYRRHDMDSKELLDYYRANAGNPSSYPYTNERSYLIGRGGDPRLVHIALMQTFLPHFFLNDQGALLTQSEISEFGYGVSDATMSSKLREALVSGFHIDFDKTSLLPRERAQGKEVGFEATKPAVDPTLSEAEVDGVGEVRLPRGAAPVIAAAPAAVGAGAPLPPAKITQSKSASATIGSALTSRSQSVLSTSPSPAAIDAISATVTLVHALIASKFPAASPSPEAVMFDPSAPMPELSTSFAPSVTKQTKEEEELARQEKLKRAAQDAEIKSKAPSTKASRASSRAIGKGEKGGKAGKQGAR